MAAAASRRTGARTAVELTGALLVALLAGPGNAPVLAQSGAGDARERISYLTFAQGAVPLRVGGTAASLGTGFEEAIRATDGNPTGFSLSRKPGGDKTDTEFLYQLPAPTIFDRFAVPNVLETPSPGETFTRDVEVHGSATGPDTGFTLLASATLATHNARGQVTELPLRARPAVRWVKVRLVGGIQIGRPQTFFEFSELIGNGTQQAPPLATHFTGRWRNRSAAIELRQSGSVVTGCYDRGGELTGTVTGTILRATGSTPAAGNVKSLFVLSVADDGSLRGVRSTNGGPFSLYTGAAEPRGASATCPELPPAQLGCGSIIHGVNFDFDSATVRPESEPVLAALHKGLAGTSGPVVIEGHTSSEGTDAYNRQLSERRAQAVVADLAKRGFDASKLKAVGFGETRPIAANADESGRVLNRRVEVKCG